jgi:hypothetical protein
LFTVRKKGESSWICRTTYFLISDVSTATRKEEEEENPAERRALVEVGITKAFVVVVNASNNAITETRSSNIRLLIMVLPIESWTGCRKEWSMPIG